MGKGDKKTRRGKITIGSFGVRRPRKAKKPAVHTKKVTPKVPKKIQEPKPKKKVDVVIEEPVVLAEPMPVNEPVTETVTQAAEEKPVKAAPKKAAPKKSPVKSEGGDEKTKTAKTRKKAAEPEGEKPVE